MAGGTGSSISEGKEKEKKKRTLGPIWGTVLFLIFSSVVFILSIDAGMILGFAIPFSIVMGFVLVLVCEVDFASKDYNTNDNYNM